ncbi:MAG: aldo/keto reductase [Defluviitaleaceae bacterium]|nr:aldo/keto reductase [Defluviitaleaceae bacterium]
MKYIPIASGAVNASAISLGCWRIAERTAAEAANLVSAALDAGINFFDNADIYSGGRAEEVFAQAAGMTADRREKIYVQTKCGIGNRCYDFSNGHILEAVEGSLRRLQTDYIDVLLLHRPDPLCEPEEVAEAFGELHDKGRVRHFGVSNFNSMQIELLQKSLGQKLVVNQMQFGPAHTGMIDAGINVNTKSEAANDRDGSVLEYCRLNNITIQAWSPFQYGFIEGVILGSEKFPELNETIRRIAAEKGVSDMAVVVAWILRHPAKIQTIVGTTKAARLPLIAKACGIELSRRDWYDIYLAAGNQLP